MSTSFRYPWLALAASAFALMIGSAFQYAHAAGSTPQSAMTGTTIDQSATQANKKEMAACKQLPLSDRGTCEAQAGYGQAVKSRSLSSSQQAALDRENARYKEAVAACKRLPVSDQTICISRAGSDRNLAAMK